MCTAAADQIGRVSVLHTHGHCCDSPEHTEALGHYQDVVKHQIEKIRNAFLGRPTLVSPVSSMAPSVVPSAAPSGDSGRRADNELKHLIDALMRLIERFANWNEAADELIEIRTRLDRYGAEMRRKVQRRKQRYKLAKSIIDRQFEAVRHKLRLRESGGGGLCGGSDADDVDRELDRLRGMMHEMSLLAESIGSAQKECLLVETVQHVTGYMSHLGELAPPKQAHVCTGCGAQPRRERAELNEFLNMMRQNAESMNEVRFADSEPNQSTPLLHLATMSGLLNAHPGTKKCRHLCCQMCLERPPMCACCDQATSPMPMPMPCADDVEDVDCVVVTSGDQVSHSHSHIHPECGHTSGQGNDEHPHAPAREACSRHNPQTEYADGHHTQLHGDDCRHQSPCSPLRHFRSTHTPAGGAQSPHTPLRDFSSPLVRSVGCCFTPTCDADLPQSTRSVCTQVRGFETPSPGARVPVCHSRSLHTPVSPTNSGCSPTRHVACSPMVFNDVTNCRSRSDYPCAQPCDWDRDARQAHDVACGQTPTPFAECPHRYGPPARDMCHHAFGYGITCQHGVHGPCGMHASGGYTCRCHDQPAATDRACSPFGVVTIDRPCSPMVVVERACSPCHELIEQTVTTGTTTVVYDTTDAGTSRQPSATRVDESTSRGSFRVDATTSRVPFDIHRSVSGVPFREADASTSGPLFLGVDAATSRSSYRRLDATTCHSSTGHKTIATSRGPSAIFRGVDTATSRGILNVDASTSRNFKAVDAATSGCSPTGYKTIATSRGPSAIFRGVDTSTSRCTFNLDASTSRPFKTVDAGTSRAPSVTFQTQDDETNRGSGREVNAATSTIGYVDMATHPYDDSVDCGVSNIACNIRDTIQQGIHQATSAMQQMFDQGTNPYYTPIHKSTSALPFRRNVDVVTRSYSAFDRGLSEENNSMKSAVDVAFNTLDNSVDGGSQTETFHKGIANAITNVMRAVDRALNNIRVLAYSVAAQPVDRATSALHHGIDSATGPIYLAVDKAANDIHKLARTIPEPATGRGCSVLHLGVEEATSSIYRAVERSIGCMHEMVNSVLADRDASTTLDDIVDDATNTISQAIERAVNNIHDLVPGDAILDEETCTYHDGVEEASSVIYVAVEHGGCDLHGLLTSLRGQPTDIASDALHQGVEATSNTILSAVDQTVDKIHTLVNSLAENSTDCAAIALHEGVDAATREIYRTVSKAGSHIREAIETQHKAAYDDQRCSSNVANFGSTPGLDDADGRIEDLAIRLRPVHHSPCSGHRSAFTGSIPEIRVIQPSLVDCSSKNEFNPHQSRSGGGCSIKKMRSTSADPTVNRLTTLHQQRATSATSMTSRSYTPHPSPVQFSTTISNPDACRPTPIIRLDCPVHGSTPSLQPVVKTSHSCTASIGKASPVFVHRTTSVSTNPRPHSCPATPVHHTHSHTEVHHITETTHVRVQRGTSARDLRSMFGCATDAFRWPFRQMACLLTLLAAPYGGRRWHGWSDVDGSRATLDHALCWQKMVRLMSGVLLLAAVASAYIMYKCREEHWPTEFVQELNLRHYGYPPT